jgi:hypothetical protein
VKRGAVVGMIGGAVAIVLAVTAGAWWFSSRPQTPDAAALAFLEALEAGDYPAIEGMLSQPPDETVQAAFAAAEDHLAEPRIIEVESTGESSSTVRAEAQLGGERVDLSVVLTSSDGRWKIAPDSLAAVRVETTLGGRPGGGDSVWVGGALVPTGSDVALLPAAYAVEAAPRGILSGTTTAAVAGATESVTLDTTLTSEATVIAQAQLDAYLQTCAAASADVPSNCGIRVPWAADLSALDGIAFRIDELPALALAADGRSFDATGGVLVATATGPSRAGGTQSFTYRADDWAVRGGVAFTGDTMVLSVR